VVVGVLAGGDEGGGRSKMSRHSNSSCC